MEKKELEMQERDLLIRLDEKINMILDQLSTFSNRIALVEQKVAKVEHLQQPCQNFISLKEQFDRSIASSERFKYWLIGLTLSSGLTILGLIVTVAIKFIK